MKPSYKQTLWKKRKDGKYQQLTVEVLGGDDPSIVTIHGIENMTMQTDTVKVLEGKNLGKSNETSKLEQALLEAESKVNQKLDEGYSLTKEDNVVFLPMLAYPYSQRISSHYGKHPEQKLNFIIQDKLDGIRGIYDSNSSCFYSRKNKAFNNLSHLHDLCKDLWDEPYYLDGEFYIHGRPLQYIAGTMNRKTPGPEHLEISYVLYDVYFPERPHTSYDDRYAELLNRVTGTMNVDRLSTLVSYRKSELQAFHNVTKDELLKLVEEYQAVSIGNGYEGLMVKCADSPYEVGRRTHNLLKYKEFEDSEFAIVDVIAPTTGREEDTAIFVCLSKSGETFNAPSTGTREARIALFENREQLIGKSLTVRYQGLTESGIPRFPKAITVRDYE